MILAKLLLVNAKTCQKIYPLAAASRCGTAHFGTTRIVQSVWGYRKMWKHSGKIFEMHEFSLPQLEYTTRALWFDICPTVKAACESDGLDFLAGVHAASHARLSS